MFIKIIVVVVILACLGLFFIAGPDGEPLLTLDDIVPASTEPAPPPEPVTVYRWKDENGVWQFSNERVEQEGVEEIVLDGKLTTMEAPAVRNPSGDFESGISALPEGVTSVSPDKLKEMAKTVTNLQETVDERKADVDKASRTP